jgi:tetratricopeptide (TPR) repeat protein
MIKKKIIILTLAMSFCFPAFVLAETIVLKSGKSVEGKLIEKTDKYIKIDFMGVPLTYFFDEIESIDGKQVMNAKEEPYSRKETIPQDIESTSTSGLKEEPSIRAELKKLGYPKDSWPSIENELNILLKKINFEHFKKEAALAKSDPAKLGNILLELVKLLKQEGYLDSRQPHHLSKLLVSSLCSEDIFSVLDNSHIALEKKKSLATNLVACSDISQLGHILLNLLGFEAKIVCLPDLLAGFRGQDTFIKDQMDTSHVINFAYLNNRNVVFIDFLYTVVKVVDLNKYYELVGRRWFLKKEYWIPPQKLSKVIEDVAKGLSSEIKMEDMLNMYYCFEIMENSSGATAFIYPNIGRVYADLKNPDKAIYYYNKSIKIEPNDASSYLNRGNAQADKGNYNQAVSDFDEAIKLDPELAEAYNSRGTIYNAKGNYDQSISDFNKAIELKSKFPEVHYNRAIAYYFKQEYAKAWSDVHKAEELGDSVDPKFLAALKKASGRDK